MIIPTTDKTVKLQERLTELTGGSCGIRDISLLESALSSAFQTFDGVELYPTVEEKCARVALSIIKNHAFIDGNKRIGMLILLLLLKLNGVHAEPTNDAVAHVGVALASGEMGYEELLKWIEDIKTAD